MAMGFCTSGSVAKTVALKPGGSRIFAAASLAGIGFDLSGSELYGVGNSEALRLSDMSSDSSGVFMAHLRVFVMIMSDVLTQSILHDASFAFDLTARSPPSSGPPTAARPPKNT